jgi:hypothetical protein
MRQTRAATRRIAMNTGADHRADGTLSAVLSAILHNASSAAVVVADGSRLTRYHPLSGRRCQVNDRGHMVSARSWVNPAGRCCRRGG